MTFDIKGNNHLSNIWEFYKDTEFYDLVDSTNTVAAQRAKDGCGEWHTVVAKGQTGGQGRLGRTFFSPSGTGLYMSTVIYPPAEKTALITGMAAVCVCEVLEREFAVHPKIKWVNDILLCERKICGILAKAHSTEKGLAVILGIGINIYPPKDDFPDDIRDTAGYLLSDGTRDVRESIAEKIIQRLRQRYKTIGWDDAPEQYRKRCITVGREVTVYPAGLPEKSRDAYALCIDDSFRLTVRYTDETVETLSSGEVSVRTK